MLVLRLKEVIMKKFIFWVLTSILYEVVIVGLGSYWLGGKIGESFIEKRNK